PPYLPLPAGPEEPPSGSVVFKCSGNRLNGGDVTTGPIEVPLHRKQVNQGAVDFHQEKWIGFWVRMFGGGLHVMLDNADTILTDSRPSQVCQLEVCAREPLVVRCPFEDLEGLLSMGPCSLLVAGFVQGTRSCQFEPSTLGAANVAKGLKSLFYLRGPEGQFPAIQERVGCSSVHARPCFRTRSSLGRLAVGNQRRAQIPLMAVRLPQRLPQHRAVGGGLGEPEGVRQVSGAGGEFPILRGFGGQPSQLLRREGAEPLSLCGGGEFGEEVPDRVVDLVSILAHRSDEGPVHERQAHVRP